MIKKVLAVIISMLIFISLFTACSNEDNDNGYDVQNDITNIDETNEMLSNVDNTSIEKNYVLQEIYSTGEISYDMLNVYFGNNDFIAPSAQINNTTDVDSFSFDDMFKYNYNGKIGYTDANGNILIKEQYDQAGVFSEGKALVRETSNSDWMIIDTKGNVLKTLSIDIKNPAECVFQNGSMVVYSQPSYEKIVVNIINSKLEVTSYEINKPSNIWTVLRFSTEEFTGVALNWGGGYSLYNEKGKEICSLEVASNNKETYYLIRDSFPKIVVSECYANIFDENGKWGLLNVVTGEMAVDCQYDYVGKYHEGVAPVKSYNKWGYIDAAGNYILTPTFERLGTLINDKAFARTSDGTTLIVDKNGNEISKCSKYYEPQLFNTKTGISMANHISSSSCRVVISSIGEILLSNENECFITKNYVFYDDRMYKIVEQ